MRNKFLKFTLLILLINPPLVSASNEIERSNLAKLISEIDFLIKRVETIKKDVDNKQKLKFHYNYLSEDLTKIKQGINDHLKESIESTREIEPLNSHYHSHK